MADNINTLSKKSKESCDAAYYCENKNWYNVAISRYYYCLFQASKNYLICQCGVKVDDFKQSENSNPLASHKGVISRVFKEIGNKNISGYKHYKDKLNFFFELKGLRIVADYDVVSEIESTKYLRYYKEKIDNLITSLRTLGIIPS